MRNDEPDHTPDERPINERLDARHYGDEREDGDRPVPAHVAPEPESEPDCRYPLTFRRASELTTDEDVARAIENAEADR